MKQFRMIVAMLIVLIPVKTTMPYAAQKNLYEGFIVSVQVPTGHYLSLHKAYKKMNEQFQRTHIRTFPLASARHLMTLINFDISINPCLMKKKKKALGMYLEQAAREAATHAIRRTLQDLQKPYRKEGVVFNFYEINIAQEYVIALFDNNACYEKLLDTLERYFRWYIQPSVHNKSIISCKRKTGIEQPYVVLATTKQRKVSNGSAYVPRECVKPFHLTKPVACVTVEAKEC